MKKYAIMVVAFSLSIASVSFSADQELLIRVNDQNENPVSNAEVSVYSGNLEGIRGDVSFFGQAKTGADGRVRFSVPETFTNARVTVCKRGFFKGATIISNLNQGLRISPISAPTRQMMEGNKRTYKLLAESHDSLSDYRSGKPGKPLAYAIFTYNLVRINDIALSERESESRFRHNSNQRYGAEGRTNRSGIVTFDVPVSATDVRFAAYKEGYLCVSSPGDFTEGEPGRDMKVAFIKFPSRTPSIPTRAPSTPVRNIPLPLQR